MLSRTTRLRCAKLPTQRRNAWFGLFKKRDEEPELPPEEQVFNMLRSAVEENRKRQRKVMTKSELLRLQQEKAEARETFRGKRPQFVFEEQRDGSKKLVGVHFIGESTNEGEVGDHEREEMHRVGASNEDVNSDFVDMDAAESQKPLVPTRSKKVNLKGLVSVIKDNEKKRQEEVMAKERAVLEAKQAQERAELQEKQKREEEERRAVEEQKQRVEEEKQNKIEADKRMEKERLAIEKRLQEKAKEMKKNEEEKRRAWEEMLSKKTETEPETLDEPEPEAEPVQEPEPEPVHETHPQPLPIEKKAVEEKKQTEKKEKEKSKVAEKKSQSKVKTKAESKAPLAEVKKDTKEKEVRDEQKKTRATKTAKGESNKSSKETTEDNEEFWQTNADLPIARVQDISTRSASNTLKAPEIVDPELNMILVNGHHRGSPEDKHKFKQLEFSGDAVMFHLFTKLLIEKYSEHPNSVFFNIRAGLISNSEIFHWAIAYDLPNAVQLASNGDKKPVSDIFEAYLGALIAGDKGDTTRAEAWLSDILDMVVSIIIRQHIADMMKVIGEAHTDPNLKGSIRESEILIRASIDAMAIPPVTFRELVRPERLLQDVKSKEFLELDKMLTMLEELIPGDADTMTIDKSEYEEDAGEGTPSS